MTQAEPNDIYQEALKSCKCACIYEKVSRKYIINNSVWVKNMNRLLETRRNYNTEEIDRILKQDLYQQLKKRTFKSESCHVKLDFVMQFEVEDNSIQSFSLCENCFVHFNHHKSKINLRFQYFNY
jgi:hypothetical protein